MSPKEDSQPTLTTPAEIPVGSTVTVTGAGFDPDELVLLGDGHAGQYVKAEVDGGFVHDMGYVYSGPGNAGVQAFVQERRTWTQIAYARFRVVEAN